MEAVLTFHTTHAVIAGEKLLLAKHLHVETAGIPPAISAGCGLCLRLPARALARALSALEAQEITQQGVYLQKASGFHKVVGQFCTYTPLEIFMAAGLVSVGLCSTSDETITDKCPYMYFSDLVVGETTCDGKVKMYELLGQEKNVHILELPAGRAPPRPKPCGGPSWCA